MEGQKSKNNKEELRGCTIKIMEEKRQDLYFIILEKTSAKLKSWEREAPLELSHYWLELVLSLEKGIEAEYLKVLVFNPKRIYFQYGKEF